MLTQLNAHEMTLLVIAMIAIARQQTTNKDTGKSPVDGTMLLALAVVLSAGMSFLVGGMGVRDLALRGIQILVQSVGGVATANYLAAKISPVAPTTPPTS